MSCNSASLGPRRRNSEDKLYQACLNACIVGIENIPVDKRRPGGVTTTPNKNTNAYTKPRLSTTNATISLTKFEPVSSLLSPPPSSSSTSPCRQQTSSVLLSTLPTTNMERSRYAGQHEVPTQRPQHMPIRGTQVAQPQRDQAAPSSTSPNMVSSWGSQDARNIANFAVQPAAIAGSTKLKKNAVKIVGAAGSLPVALKATVSTPPELSVAPGPVMAKPEAERPAPVKAAATTVASASAPKPMISMIETPKLSTFVQSDLDNLYARLSVQSPTSTSKATEDASCAGPDKDMFSFDSLPRLADKAKKDAEVNIAATQRSTAQADKLNQEMTAAYHDVAKETVRKLETADKNSKETFQGTVPAFANGSRDMLLEELEREYLYRANKYINILPGSKGTTAQIIRGVVRKLHNSYLPHAEDKSDQTDKLKARYVFAITTFVNKLKKGPKPLTTDFVRQTLKNTDGNFLGLLTTLVDANYITLNSTDDVVGLCKTILDVLPRSELKTASHLAGTTPFSNDPVDNMKVWPSQEKRETPASFRTCILKGVSGITSINQLQTLVWGGKIESLSLPVPGADFALVKFLTAEGCEKYFEATRNGIKISGVKTAIIFVERTAGPNSTNDLVRNCSEGDVSRCVRVVGVGDEWNDITLHKVARGKGKVKRELDTIKRGKTARGHNFVEFRFATIYHALNFKRELLNDEDWEHCTIGYASDPCERAHSVHTDADDGIMA